MKQYEELFINGQRVNVGDTNITLEWKSVIFSDISKYVASHSYTVKLPMTQHNRRIFAGMEMLEKAEAEDTRAVVGKRMSARYYCNGVDLLGDANAYLMGTDGENYKITLTWNAITGFKEMNEEERKIPEILFADPFTVFHGSSHGAVQAEDRLHQRGLSRTVLTDDTKVVTLTHGEADILRDHSPVIAKC